MANTKISDLTAATSVSTSDIIPIVQGGVTKRAAVSLLPTGSSSSTGGSPNVVYTSAPPTGSGLTATAADGTTDDAAAINAALNWVKTNRSGGTVELPAGKTLKVSSGLTIPSKVTLRVPNSTTLDFSAMTSGIAITINDTDFMPLDGTGYMNGPGKTSTVTAIKIAGSGVQVKVHRVNGWGTGINLSSSNTYIVSVSGISIGNCGRCILFDGANDLGGGAITNSGERMTFSGITFYNSDQASYFTGGGGQDAYFFQCSFDFCNDFGYATGNVHYDQCHFETSPSGTSNGYAFTLAYNGRMYFNDCFMIFGMFSRILKSATGPSNYNSGRVFYNNVSCFYTASDGTARTVHSDNMVFTDGTASQTFYSPFVSKFGPTSIARAANDGTAEDSGGVPYISAISSANGTITVSWIGTPPASGKALRIMG